VFGELGAGLAWLGETETRAPSSHTRRTRNGAATVGFFWQRGPLLRWCHYGFRQTVLVAVPAVRYSCIDNLRTTAVAPKVVSISHSHGLDAARFSGLDLRMASNHSAKEKRT